MTISFMSANFVARCVGFDMTGGWGQGDRTTNEYFRPLETFPERFEELLTTVRSMGFEAIDLWNPHLNWSWATEEHIAIATDLLQRHQLTVTSLAGGFGDSREEFEAACKLAVAVGTRILGGSTSVLDTDRDAAIALLEQYDLELGIENHPHVATPEAMLAAIGDGGRGRIGTTVDTGWYATVGCDVVQTIEELADHIVLIHLKDIRAAGAHDTCRYGEGIVPIEACVRALQRLGYRGDYSVEHEPELFDPTEDCKADLAMLREWLAS